MPRRPARKRSGIFMPAAIALVCAALLLAGAVFGQKPERWLGGKRQAESI